MEIIPGIHWIPCSFVNVYVHGDAELTLIDAATKGKSNLILDYIKNTMHREPADVKTICLTHADMDHVGSLAALKEATGAAVASHSIEADLVAGRQFKSRSKAMKMMAKVFMRFPRVEVDQKLENGDTVAGLQVVFVPGHSPGETAYYDPERKALFSGDAILTDKSGTVQGPRPMMTPDIAQAWQSVEVAKALDVEVLLPGHGKPATKDVNEQLKALTKPAKK